MKSKLSCALILVWVLVGVSSCKKKTESCKLGRYYATDGSSTPAGGANVFEYDASGRISKITYSSKQVDSLVRVADTLWVYTFDAQHLLAAELRGITNGSGFVTSAVKTSYDIAGTVTGTVNYLYEYNVEGNLTKKTSNDGTGTTILSISYTGGNSVSGLQYNGVNLDKKYFFYHSTVANKTGIDDFGTVFTPYFGKASAQLLDSAHVVVAASSDTLRVQYTHTLDANEYVSKTVESWLTPTVNTTYHIYQYFDCKE